MKYTTLIFLLCSLSAQAQTITKSFVLSPDSVNYFEVVRETNDATGAYSESAVLVGPASALAADQADKIESRLENLANAAFVVSYTKKRIAEEKTVSDTIFSQTGISPLIIIKDRHKGKFIAPGWTIDPGTGPVSISFSENAQGVIRYSVNGGTTKAADILGENLFVLYNYPSSGTDTQFFRNEDGKQYFSLPNRAMKIKKP